MLFSSDKGKLQGHQLPGPAMLFTFIRETLGAQDAARLRWRKRMNGQREGERAGERKSGKERDILKLGKKRMRRLEGGE